MKIDCMRPILSRAIPSVLLAVWRAVPRFRNAQSAHRLVSGRDTVSYHNPYSHPWIEQRRTRTKLLLGVFQAPSIFTVTRPTNPQGLSGLLQQRHQALRSSAPCGTSPVSTKRQSNQQFSCQGHYAHLGRRFPFPLNRSRSTGQFTAWLIAKPSPGKFDQQTACPSVSGFADALIPIHTSAGIWTRRQAKKRCKVSSTGNLRDEKTSATSMLAPFAPIPRNCSSRTALSGHGKLDFQPARLRGPPLFV
jgi:hypothetical protein